LIQLREYICRGNTQTLRVTSHKGHGGMNILFILEKDPELCSNEHLQVVIHQRAEERKHQRAVVLSEQIGQVLGELPSGRYSALFVQLSIEHACVAVNMNCFLNDMNYLYNCHLV